MKTFRPYLFLIVAVFFGAASNSFVKSAEGFTKFTPSIISALTIILCMYSLSNVMKTLPVGTTYASFAGLCIIATSFVGFVRFNQLPNIYSIFGLLLIIIGVGLVNILGQN